MLLFFYQRVEAGLGRMLNTALILNGKANTRYFRETQVTWSQCWDLSAYFCISHTFPRTLVFNYSFFKEGQKNRAKILPWAPKAVSSSSPASSTPIKPKNKPSNRLYPQLVSTFNNNKTYYQNKYPANWIIISQEKALFSTSSALKEIHKQDLQPPSTGGVVTAA